MQRLKSSTVWEMAQQCSRWYRWLGWEINILSLFTVENCTPLLRRVGHSCFLLPEYWDNRDVLLFSFQLCSPFYLFHPLTLQEEGTEGRESLMTITESALRAARCRMRAAKLTSASGSNKAWVSLTWCPSFFFKKTGNAEFNRIEWRNIHILKHWIFYHCKVKIIVQFKQVEEFSSFYDVAWPNKHIMMMSCITCLLTANTTRLTVTLDLSKGRLSHLFLRPVYTAEWNHFLSFQISVLSEECTLLVFW